MPPRHPSRPSGGPGHGGSQTPSEREPVSDPQPSGSPPTADRGDKVLFFFRTEQSESNGFEETGYGGGTISHYRSNSNCKYLGLA